MMKKCFTLLLATVMMAVMSSCRPSVDDVASKIVENQELTSKMQPMPSRDEAEHLIDSLPAMEVFSIPDAQERKAYIDELMHQKGNGGLLKVIKSLYGIKRQRIREGKSLHVADENALHEALRLLCDELAYPLGTEPSQIFDRLQTTLEENA